MSSCTSPPLFVRSEAFTTAVSVSEGVNVLLVSSHLQVPPVLERVRTPDEGMMVPLSVSSKSPEAEVVPVAKVFPVLSERVTVLPVQ